VLRSTRMTWASRSADQAGSVSEVGHLPNQLRATRRCSQSHFSCHRPQRESAITRLLQTQLENAAFRAREAAPEAFQLRSDHR
jgi:hypothetical protein